MEAKKQHSVFSMIGALIGAVALSVLLNMKSADPIALENRSTSPGFGWSWDFDYQRAMAEHHLTLSSPANRLPAPPADQLTLPIDEPVSVSGLRITYRGMTRSGRFHLDLVIDAFNTSYSYSHELSEAEAREGFSLADERFTLVSIWPNVLRLRHLSR